MQLYCQTSNFSYTVPDYVLSNQNVSGIVIDVPVTKFLLMGGGYNAAEAKYLCDAIRSHYEKKINNQQVKKYSSVSINFGQYMPEVLGIKLLTFMESRHNKPSGTHPVNQPVFYPDSEGKNPFFDFVDVFFHNLKKTFIQQDAYKYLTYIKISPVGYFNFELRACDFHNTGTGDPYENAADIWLLNGWTNNKVRVVIAQYIDVFKAVFPDKIICLQVIGGKSGFPRIDDTNKFCTLSLQPNIGQEMVNYGLKYSNFAPGTTAITDNGNTPVYVYHSGATEIIGQIAESVYSPQAHTGKTPIDPQGALNNAKNNNCTFCETFVNSIRAFPNQHV